MKQQGACVGSDGLYETYRCVKKGMLCYQVQPLSSPGKLWALGCTACLASPGSCAPLPNVSGPPSPGKMVLSARPAALKAPLKDVEEGNMPRISSPSQIASQDLQDPTCSAQHYLESELPTIMGHVPSRIRGCCFAQLGFQGALTAFKTTAGLELQFGPKPTLSTKNSEVHLRLRMGPFSI